MTSQQQNSAKGGVANRLRAAEHRADMVPLVVALAGDGMTQQQIADALNNLGFRTRQQRKPWTRLTVLRMLNFADVRPVLKRGRKCSKAR